MNPRESFERRFILARPRSYSGQPRKEVTVKKATKQAIEAPRKSLFMMDPHEIVIIGLDTDDGPGHPRYDVRCHENFVENIVLGMIEYGVKEPIQVVKVDEHLEAVNGRQRLINLREANRRIVEHGGTPQRIPVMPPEHGSDAKMAALMGITNTHRVEMTPLSLATMAQNAYDRGFVDEEVARNLNVSIPTIKNYISLLSLKPEVQKLIAMNKIAATKGYELARKGTKAQEIFLKRRETGSRSGPPKRAPSKQALRKLVDEGQLDKMFLLGLKYALGDIASLEDYMTHKIAIMSKDKPELRLVEGEAS